MKEIIFPYIEEQIKRLEVSENDLKLEQKVVLSFKENLWKTGEYICAGFCEKHLSDEELLPASLTQALQMILKNRTDAFLEMIRRISLYRNEISSFLFKGRSYTKILDIIPGAGDTHNRGRAVCVVNTDVGKFVYKPRDMRGEVFFGKMMKRYLKEKVCLPDCLAFKDRFGVSSFVEKKRASGEKEAACFYRNFGSLAAFLKAMGSTDMHMENISCAGVFPVVLDLETILSPLPAPDKRNSEDLSEFLEKRNSVYYTTLIPRTGKKEDSISPLLNCTEDGCAPEINGQKINVISYLDQFEAGFHETYRMILENREAMIQELKTAAPGIRIRVLLANTRNYMGILKKIFSYQMMSSAETEEKKKQQMLKEMSLFSSEKDIPVLSETLNQLFFGDIPYFYLEADGTDVLSDSKTVVSSYFMVSPLEHAVRILNQMGDSDEKAERKRIRKMKQGENNAV